MAFMINPQEGDNGGGAARPDVREGRKVLACVGMEGGTTQGGNPKWSTTWVVVRDPDGGQDVGALVWETLTLTQAAAWKIRIIAQALGQSSSWHADDREEMWKVLSRGAVMGEIVLEQSRSGRTDRDGNVRMDARINRWHRTSQDFSDEEKQVVRDGRSWYRSWQEKRSNGPSGGRSTHQGDPTSWDGNSSSGGGDSWDSGSNSGAGWSDEEIPF